MATCGCGDSWRVVTVDLKTGIVRAVLEPISMEWETRLNDVGQGTVLLATGDVNVRDIWPHLSAIYILRLEGSDASPEMPVCEFAGLIETVIAEDTGVTTLGIRSMEQYLFHRTIKRRIRVEEMPQTRLAKLLHDESIPNGINLTALADSSTILRDRTYQPWLRKNIGEAVTELTQVINGPDWETRHNYDPTAGTWATEMIYRDFVGENRNVVLRSDVEAFSYSLEIASENHATHVDAIGNGENKSTLIESADDESGVYPQLDAAPAWKDVTRRKTLQSHAQGYIEDYREPFASPSVTLRGLDNPEPSLIRLGDTVRIETNYGAVTYNGDARIIAISWAVGDGEPEARTLTTLPITRASQSVLNQEPTNTCEDC